MRVVLRTPDNAIRDQIVRALSVDDHIEIVEEVERDEDVLLIHADLFHANGRPLQSLTKEARTIIACAPRDPERLSGFMAAGVLGYHCVDEPWETLIDVLRLVDAGGARSDPLVMNQLLLRYRQLLRGSMRR
ncbi:MAG: hypothetical protein R3A46_10985 [Thermomicrobiales bacterium]